MVAPSARPLAIAHRGFSQAYPENTLAAFDAALEHPVDGFEFDVQITSDEVPILFHDSSLRRVSGSLALVRFRTAAQMGDLDYGKWFDTQFTGTALLDLDTFLARYRGRTRLLLELKVEKGVTRGKRRHLLAEIVTAAVRRHNAAASVEILCFDLDTLKYCHKLAPEIPCVLNQRKPRFLPEASFLGAYSCSIRGLTQNFVETVHGAGKPVYCFTINDEARMQQALDAGVDAVMSDRTPWMLQQLTRRFGPPRPR
ncbi:glycerophosphodiester phosphodiesterase [Acanthopleuribacter pedis]|uniref:GP-PDE domain-containing protein n=1 Tax=Acanthopleuribacter pedis TaxID=442870 RepID=A0A8J7QKX6_9BACT|nr:glycerophosphodiester phosphodiesterase family protein [Acanthopleuribacter pedis]MBO1320138.1 hypothetical protein [Acanthopleuribacter pedis]